MAYTADTPITELVFECQQQLRKYRRSQLVGDSSYCSELVRRAIAGNSDAIGALLYTISKPMIESVVQQSLPTQTEDIAQDVYERLLKRLQNQQKPLYFSEFAQFRSFLNTVIRSAIIEAKAKKEGWYSPTPEPSLEQQAENAEIFERILNQLEPCERKVMEHYIGFLEPAREIYESLKTDCPNLTQKRVYELLRSAKRNLKNNPYVINLMRRV